MLRQLGVSVEPPPLRSHLQLMRPEEQEEQEEQEELELMGVTVSAHPCARCASQ